MASHRAQDPDGIEVLADKVNEIFRPLVKDIFPHGDPIPGLAKGLPMPSPRVLEIYDQIQRVAGEDPDLKGMTIVAVSVREASQILELAVGGALTHQAEEHPERGWIECPTIRMVVYLAARMFVVRSQEAEIL